MARAGVGWGGRVRISNLEGLNRGKQPRVGSGTPVRGFGRLTEPVREDALSWGHLWDKEEASVLPGKEFSCLVTLFWTFVLQTVLRFWFGVVRSSWLFF